MTFCDTIKNFSWDEVREDIYSKTPANVSIALDNVRNGTIGNSFSTKDFKALVSPAAAPFLEEMASMSREITQKRFGKTVQMYIPLYLSNECRNFCTYCGFSMDNKIGRITLPDEQILNEAEIIESMGFDHVLLVTGEANKTVGIDYLVNAMEIIRPRFANVSMEVQPLEVDEYRKLADLGLHAVFIYQETYNRKGYEKHHPKGRKANYNYRLETPDRLGKAGIHKVGLGFLIGLEDWRADAFSTALHLNYLEKKYWKTKYSISFPRLRPAAGAGHNQSVMNDRELLQLICAYRIFNENVELSLSTRESENFRDHVIGLGITSISAGSKTNPGGYSNGQENLEQFEINDNRSPQEVAEMIRSRGYEVVWKDWEAIYG